MKIALNRFLFVLFLIVSVSSQAAGSFSPGFVKNIAGKFSKQWTTEQQEKVYLQTDKPYYSAGENIWFKGYVVNATTHLPKSLSRFLYVELIDKSNAVVSRVKIKKDSLGFSGYVKLKSELHAGNYALRAYTYWMQNASTDFFFTKNIYIGNPIDDYVLSDITYGTNVNGKVTATINLTDAYKNPISGKSIDVFQNWNNPQNKKRTLVTSADGKINLQLTVDTTFHSTRIIDVSMNEPGNRYKNRFYLPEFSYDFDVQFFPESGNLLEGQLQLVAFKAIGTDGLAVDVSGKVYSDKNEEISDFSSFNKGMGKFSLQVDSGRTYYAIVKSAKGIEKRFPLPKSQNQGIALHLGYSRGKLFYEIMNKTREAHNAFYLLIHSRGRLLAGLPVNELSGQISESLLPPGIVSMSIVDTLGNTYCERICFVRNPASPAVRMESNKPVYGKREPVDLSFNIRSATGNLSAGNYSLSITDSKVVKLDSLSDNIMTYLLLSSDIKGHIEEPSGYFTDNQAMDREKMDNLMLTQGWRRFNTADVVKGKIKEPTYYLEAGQALSGKVLNILNKPSKKCGIIMISPYKRTIKLAETDSLGRYLIDGIEFPDSTTFVLKAKKEKNFGDVEVIPDVDEFPKSNVLIPMRCAQDLAVPNDYFSLSKEKYFSDGGMRVVNLEGVTVKAAKVEKSKETHFYSGMEDAKLTSEKLEEYPGMGVLDLLSMVSGVQVNGDQVSIRGGNGNPLFLIDEIESQSMDDITYLNSTDIEEISVFKGASAAIFGSRGGNGVVAISLKKGVVRKAETPLSLVTVTPLGYEKPAAFYVPKYEVDSVRLDRKSDLRSTIYWNPELVSDSLGNVHVKFFTADKANDYSVVLEGISEKGEICRYVGCLRRKGE
ncbi:MAG: TonB-dependent receptor plug domain-containing protein [Paludibacter sp.]